MTVLREPIATWISGIRYNNKEAARSAEGVVAAMREDLATRGAYANAITYLVESDRQRKAPPAAKSVSSFFAT